MSINFPSDTEFIDTSTYPDIPQGNNVISWGAHIPSDGATAYRRLSCAFYDIMTSDIANQTYASPPYFSTTRTGTSNDVDSNNLTPNSGDGSKLCYWRCEVTDGIRMSDFPWKFGRN